MDVLAIFRDALCSKEINKEILNFTNKFWLLFTFQQGPEPFECIFSVNFNVN